MKQHRILWFCLSGAAFGLLCVMALTGCTSMPMPEQKVQVQVVHDRVPVTCVPDNAPVMPPDYPDKPDAIAKAGVQMRAQIVVAANITLHDRNDVLEQVLKTCLMAGTVPTRPPASADH